MSNQKRVHFENGMNRKVKVAIASSGRFHVLDLARELDRLDYDVSFYSYVPVRMAEKFGLRRECQKSLFWLFAPLVGLTRYGPRFMSRWVNQILTVLLDHAISWWLEPCDVFIGLSGLSVQCAKKARVKYGAKVLIERGSTHILKQQSILRDILLAGGNSQQVLDFDVEREMKGYELADLIVVPSINVENSFMGQGVKKEKLFRNPYGVNLNMFKTLTSPGPVKPNVIFVGTWSYRKGCDLLLEIMKKLPDIKFTHVGAFGDMELPKLDNFTHYDPVKQWELSRFYEKAHVFVLASREEGLAMVQAQALASGLYLVCTDMTGGKDLRELISDKKRITVAPSGDSKALQKALQLKVNEALRSKGRRGLSESDRQKLSWENYGKRYSRKIEEILIPKSYAN